MQEENFPAPGPAWFLSLMFFFFARLVLPLQGLLTRPLSPRSYSLRVVN